MWRDSGVAHRAMADTLRGSGSFVRERGGGGGDG